MIRVTFLATVLLALFASAAHADRIVLRDARAVEGEILKETDEKLFVDLGFTVLEIPQSAVLRVEKTEEEKEEGEKRLGVYYTAKLEPAPIKKHAETYGEAVVLVKTASGLGSGFIIHEDGYVVTNYHVVERELNITITIFVRTEHELQKVVKEKVRIVALNPFLDMALLKIEDAADMKLKKVYLGDSSEVRAGDTVFAIGNPLGLERSVSEGIVSTATREFGGLLFIQTTAQINPGNSGGPLFNERGEVVGVTNMKMIFSEGLGFAIPVDYVKDFLDNREAFAFDKDNPNTGNRYFQPPGKGEGPEQK